jgi:sugar phosphate permease
MYGASSFNPAYLSRSHDWTSGQVGQLVAMAGLAGLAGSLFGGIVTDRLIAARAEPRWQLWAPGIATLIAIPVQIIAYLGSGVAMTTALLLSSALSLVFFGPSYAAAQSLAAPRMRAVAASMLLFSKALVGMGFGPLLVGMLSDRLAPALAENSLRWALLLVPLFNAWAGWHFFIAARHLRADLRRLSAHGRDLPVADPAPFR